MSETKQMFKNAMILFAITLVAGILLGVVYQVTKAPIANQEQLAETKANQEVFPDAASFADAELDTEQATKILESDAAYAKVSIDSVKIAKDASGKAIGYVLQISSGGYADDIVRQTQGGSSIIDQTKLQRNQSELAKAISMFTQYFNVVYNLARRAGHDVKSVRNVPALLGSMLILFIAPAIYEGMLRDDDQPEEDEAQSYAGTYEDGCSSYPRLAHSS